MLIYRLFRLFSTSENSLRMPPDTDVNLLLIQTPSSKMVQSMDAFLILIPDGIFKPIPDKFLSLLPMASLSPSPNGISKPIPASIALTSANFRAL